MTEQRRIYTIEVPVTLESRTNVAASLIDNQYQHISECDYQSIADYTQNMVDFFESVNNENKAQRILRKFNR
ncbi:hypothetical protein [Pleionea sediminis]|uniref:hypothetical protein n=1 Tax=Pleionea sediminis TaxID=2569479 RepID=UPI0011846BA0|nr:hypothetical protein [Pleionea sediminis]